MRYLTTICLFGILLLNARVSLAETADENGNDASVPDNSENGENSTANNAEQTHLNKEIYRGEKLIGWGTLTLLIGAGGVITGVVIIVRAANYETDPEQPTMGPGFAYAIGLTVTGISLIPLFSGIALCIKGNRKRKSALEKLEHFPSVSLMSGGLFNTRMIGIGWNF